MGLFETLLMLHILSVVVGLGPSFAMPVLGGHLQKHPESVVTLGPLVDRIGNFPKFGGMAVILTGVGLVWVKGWGMLQEVWLIAAIILSLGATLIGMTVMEPAGKRMAALAGAAPVNAAQVQQLNGKLRQMGLVNDLLLLIIVILMIYKPTL